MPYQSPSSTLTMNKSDDKLCLKWNDFGGSIISSICERRKDLEFSDVTLACLDGKHIEAHKVILASASPFFLDLLRRNKNPHSLIYMRGIKSEDLEAIVDFLYHGEANVYQEQMESFLTLAEELKLEGLSGKQNVEYELTSILPTQTKPKLLIEKEPLKLEMTGLPNELEQTHEIHMESDFDQTVTADLQNLDGQIKSMMDVSEAKITSGRELARICRKCGKEGEQTSIRRHIEAKHITGISHICNVCGKSVKSRHALRMHKQFRHSQGHQSG